MTKLEEIEQDVAALSADDLTRFRDWFDAFESERFDRPIETGISAEEFEGSRKTARVGFL